MMRLDFVRQCNVIVGDSEGVEVEVAICEIESLTAVEIPF